MWSSADHQKNSAEIRDIIFKYEIQLEMVSSESNDEF